jgi:MOSC domain-containing protein YiiM
LRDGRFGENLTTVGADVNGAMLGDRWRVGTALIEVTGPRVPCAVFGNWLDEPGWVKRFTDGARAGAYFRVIEQGELGAGDEIHIVHRPDESVTVTEAFRAYHGDVELIHRILALPGHAARWDEVAARVLSKA